jgi:hypothetical protein
MRRVGPFSSHMLGIALAPLRGRGTKSEKSVIFLSRVMRHVSIATGVYILACDGKGARAPGGHGTANSPGDHDHGSS